MTYIGFILAEDGALALTYGPQEDMEAWAALHVKVDKTTALFPADEDTDCEKCITDPAYFQSLLA